VAGRGEVTERGPDREDRGRLEVPVAYHVGLLSTRDTTDQNGEDWLDEAALDRRRTGLWRRAGLGCVRRCSIPRADGRHRTGRRRSAKRDRRAARGVSLANAE
jgi:hypothetical protein